MRIGWDLDGVGYDFPEALKAFAADYEGVDPATMSLPAQEWNWWESQWGWDKPRFSTINHRGILSGALYGRRQVMDGFAEGLRRVVLAGGTNHVVTARPIDRAPLLATQTARWLKDVDLADMVEMLTFSRDKGVVAWDAYLDDHAPTIETLREHGLNAYLLDAPYNRANFEDLDEWRVTSIDKFLSLAGVA